MRGDGGQPMTAESGGRRAVAGGRPRSALPILLGVAAGLAICALAYFALTLRAGPTPDPTPTARAICADLTTQKYDSLYTLLSPDLQSQGTEAQFVASQRELDSLLGPTRTCQAAVMANTGSQATIALTLQRGQTAAKSAQVALAEAQGNWRITSYDQTV